jgi:subtilase family serine protease
MKTYGARGFLCLFFLVLLAQTCILSAIAQGRPDAVEALPAVPRGSVPTAVEQRKARFVQPLAPELPMRITVVLLPPKRSDLQKLVAQITDPRSPRYRQFLTYEQWKREYAPSENDVGVVADWAKQAGLEEVYRFPTNTAVVVQGSVATVERALRVQLSEYDFNGHHFFSNNRRPSLPPDIASIPFLT